MNQFETFGRRAMVAGLAVSLLEHWRVGHTEAQAGSRIVQAALLAGVQDAEGGRAVEFDLTDTASSKALYVYRLLVHDKTISPMSEDQVGEKTIRHRLTAGYAHQLPEGRPLLE